MQQLTPLDAMFAYQEVGNQYMHVAGLNIYDPSTVPAHMKRRDGVLSHKDIMRWLELSLPAAPNMRRKLVRLPGDLDHPYWVEDSDFDIEFHVRHIGLPKPGDWRQLCILVARLHARRLDMSRPLWESYIIEGLDNIPGLPPGCFALFTKVHHAAIDGATGAHQTAAMHTLNADDEKALYVPEDTWKPESDPSLLELFVRAQMNIAATPFRIQESFWKAVSGISRVGQGFQSGDLKGVSLAPRTRFSGSVSPHRVFNARAYALDDVRAMKKALDGATVNDVVLAVCSGALRHYLQDKKELPKEPLVAMVPVNVRTEEEKGEGGNVVSSMSVALATDSADPKKRLKTICETTRDSKALTKAIGAREMVEFGGLTPAALAGLGSRLAARLHVADYATLPMNVTITNVPGPQMPLYSGGARLMVTFGLAPNMDGQGLIIVIQSYAGVLTISFSACRKQMPDPEFFAECIDESFHELQKALTGRVSPQIKAGDILQVTTPQTKTNGHAKAEASRAEKKPKAPSKAVIAKRATPNGATGAGSSVN